MIKNPEKLEINIQESVARWSDDLCWSLKAELGWIAYPSERKSENGVE